MPQNTLRIFHEIRYRVGGMRSEDCRQELMDTLEALDQLEADFKILCREVAILATDYHSKTYATTREFDRVCDERGVVLPDLA